MPRAGRKRIFETPQERRKHQKVIYTRVAAREAFHAQRKILGKTLLDYMDILAETHADPKTSFYKVKLKSGYEIMIPAQLMLDLTNKTITDPRLTWLLKEAHDFAKIETPKEE